MLRVSSTCLAVLFLLAACDAPAPSATPDATSTATAKSTAGGVATDKPTAAKPNSFGDPITATNETTLASIASDPAKFANQEVKTTGTVKAVCKKAGCWMEIGDDTSQAHIKMAGHKFLVPRDCDGRKAVVQGTVKDGAPQNECGSKDQCGGEENGAVAKVEIIATGVEFVD